MDAHVVDALERIIDALEHIASALERQANNDPLALLNAALADAPEGIDLGLDTHSLGGGRWVATVSLAAVSPGWSLNLTPSPSADGGVRVEMVGPAGERHPLVGA